MWFLIIGRCSALARNFTCQTHINGESVSSHTQILSYLPTESTWNPKLKKGGIPVSPGWRATSYLSRLTGNGNAAILVVFDRCPSLLHQGPIPGAGVKRGNSSPTCTNPLCKRALQVSNQHTIRGSSSPLLCVDTETLTDTVPLSRGLSF